MQRISRARDQVALHIALQEALRIVVEQPIAAQAVGQGRETAAGDTDQEIDIVKRCMRIFLGVDLRATQFLQDAVSERRRARAAAGNVTRICVSSRCLRVGWIWGRYPRARSTRSISGSTGRFEQPAASAHEHRASDPANRRVARLTRRSLRRRATTRRVHRPA